MTPALSVVIPTRDRPQSLQEALASLVNQRLGRALQVIVVNDGGSGVDAAVEPYRAAFDLELINAPAASGPSHARNAAIDVARGRYLAFLDDDDVLLPGHFRATMKLLDETDADFVYTTLMVSTTRAAPGMSHESGGWPAFDLPFDPEYLHVTNFIPPLGVTMRSPRERGIRFDPRMVVVEDWELWLRLLVEHRYRFVHLDRASGVYHRVPRYDTAPDPPAETARVLHLFHDAWRATCERYPVRAGSRAEASRTHVQHMYELAFARLAGGAMLPAFWYERMVRLVHEEFTGELDARELRDRLGAAMNG